VYIQGNPAKKNSIVLAPDRLQDDSLTACTIAQQYSSANFVSLRFHYRKGKFGDVFKNVYFSFVCPFKNG
jgi:hypothetical protein